jgi:hypothetical protein
MWDAQRAMPGAFKKYAERLYEVTGYGINLIDADAVSDADLQKANKHLMGKGFDKQQGKARMREYQDWFSSLPAGDRRLIMDVSDYYRRTHEALVDGSIRNTLRAALPNLKKAQVDLVVEASKRNAVTHGTYDAILGKNTVDAINDLASHRTGEGMYFPQMRHGKWVVSWREKLGDTFGGNEVSPGVLEWTGDDAVEQAEKFRDNTNLHVSNFRKSEADDGAPVARLYVQTLGTSFFESEADAADFVKQLRGDPTVEWSSDYSLSDKANYTPQGMTQMSVSKLIANVNQQTNTTSNAALIREAARQAAIQLLPGTRLAQRTLTRRNVKGADTDLARALAQYSEAITRALAKQEFMPELYEAMDAYEKLVKSEPEHPSYRLRRMFLNEFRNRVDSNVVNFSEPPQWVHNLMALSFLDKLFSVAYSVVNSLQPLAVTYPYLAGKFGQVQTVSAIRRAYASIGFTDAVIGGAKNTGKAITNIRRTELLDTSDIHGSIRKKLAAQPDGAALASLFDFATERGAIDPEAGFELAQSIAQSQGKLAEGISRVDRIARQMPQAVEQVNRAVTLVAAYRLAKKAGASHEAAMDEAIVATRNTQGDYSAVNASPVFNTTPGRIALQFKKYAQMMIFLLGDMLYRGFKGATAEERSQARKQIASLVGVQVAFAGVLGLPGLELIRYGAMAMAGLGLGGGYEEWERYVRESISEMTSPYVADLLTRGVIPRALNLDLSAKMGLDSLLTFGEPRDYRQDGVVFFLTSQVVGAPGMLVFDQFRAANEITQGLVNADSEQLLKGIEKIPLGATVTNAIKATRLGTYGVSSGSTGKQFIEPSGVGTMAANVLGFNTAEQSLAYERQGAFRAADTELDDIDRRIRIFRNKYAEADTAGERVKMIKDMKALNESLPEDRRLTRDDLERFRKRYLRDLKEGRVVENYRLGKDIEAERMREIQSVYTR